MLDKQVDDRLGVSEESQFRRENDDEEANVGAPYFQTNDPLRYSTGKPAC